MCTPIAFFSQSVLVSRYVNTALASAVVASSAASSSSVTAAPAHTRRGLNIIIHGALTACNASSLAARMRKLETGSSAAKRQDAAKGKA